MIKISGRLVLALACCLVSAAAQAADIKVLAGSGVQPVMADLVPKFEASSGHKVTFDWGTVGGMAERVRQGEAADVVIAAGPQIEALEKVGKVVAGSRTDLAKAGVGVFVRKGAVKPDIGSVDAFKRAMLAAKSIGWNDPAAGAPVSIYMLVLFERLGIAAEMKDRTVTFKQRSERFEAVHRRDRRLQQGAGREPCAPAVRVIARCEGGHEGEGIRRAVDSLPKLAPDERA